MTLSTIARSMRFSIDQAPRAWIERTLPRGLSVVLSHDNEAYRLAIAREGVYPSDQEIAVCAQTFGVPEGTEPVRRLSHATRPKTGRRAHLHVVELMWRELRAPDRPE